MSQPLSQQSTQAIIGIVFGIVMFILTLIALSQGYMRKCRNTGAVVTPGQPCAITSDMNVTTLEDGTYHHPAQGHRVISCRPLNAWVLQKLTAISPSYLLPHTKQWSKTFPNNRKRLKHILPPTSLVTRVLDPCWPNPERLFHHRSHPHHHLKQ